MIQFYKKRNLFRDKNLTHLNLNDLLKYLADVKYKENWYGISFQFDYIQRELALLKRNNKNIKNLDNEQLTIFIEKFLNKVSEFDLKEFYIQPCYPNKLFNWFYRNIRRNQIYIMKPLFKIFEDNNFIEQKGYITLNFDYLSLIFKNLFFYSFITNSQDLFIISATKPIVIMLGQHLSIDVLTNEKDIFDFFYDNLKDEIITAKIYQN